MKKLTETDKLILNSYINIVKGLSILFKNTEIVLHSLEDLQSSIICIENGHITKRNIGDTSTNFILNYIEQEENNKTNIDYWKKPYFNITKTGKNIKSISIPIRNNNNTIGFLCLNIDLDIKLSELIECYYYPKNEQNNQNNKQDYFNEILENDFSSLAYEMIQTTVKSVNQSVIKRKDQNNEVIKDLHSKGFFKIKGSTKILADYVKRQV